MNIKDPSTYTKVWEMACKEYKEKVKDDLKIIFDCDGSLQVGSKKILYDSYGNETIAECTSLFATELENKAFPTRWDVFTCHEYNFAITTYNTNPGRILYHAFLHILENLGRTFDNTIKYVIVGNIYMNDFKYGIEYSGGPLVEPKTVTVNIKYNLPVIMRLFRV